MYHSYTFPNISWSKVALIKEVLCNAESAWHLISTGPILNIHWQKRVLWFKLRFSKISFFTHERIWIWSQQVGMLVWRVTLTVFLKTTHIALIDAKKKQWNKIKNSFWKNILSGETKDFEYSSLLLPSMRAPHVTFCFYNFGKTLLQQTATLITPLSGGEKIIKINIGRRGAATAICQIVSGSTRGRTLRAVRCHCHSPPPLSPLSSRRLPGIWTFQCFSSFFADKLCVNSLQNMSQFIFGVFGILGGVICLVFKNSCCASVWGLCILAEMPFMNLFHQRKPLNTNF